MNIKYRLLHSLNVSTVTKSFEMESNFDCQRARTRGYSESTRKRLIDQYL